ncbi:MAG: branched-chain amino acid ABC transporter permease [Thermoplasmatota archaeon]
MWRTLAIYAVNGVVIGGIIALAAIGLTLVYGILNLSNFAHGDYLTLGAYVGLYFNVLLLASDAVAYAHAGGELLVAWALLDVLFFQALSTSERWVIGGSGGVLAGYATLVQFPRSVPGYLSSSIVLAALIAIVGVAIAAVLLDLLLWRPLRRRRANLLTLVIASIGLSLALRSLLQIQFGVDNYYYNLPLTPATFYFGVPITNVQLWTFGVATVLVVGVYAFLRWSKTGKGFRALADNRELARASGIDVDRMVLKVWALAGALAGIAGVLLALNINVNPDLGWDLLLAIFAAVILGGIGSATGAMLGAIVLGVAMEVSVYWVPQYRAAVGFAILILALLLRPQGLLGVKS